MQFTKRPIEYILPTDVKNLTRNNSQPPFYVLLFVIKIFSLFSKLRIHKLYEFTYFLGVLQNMRFLSLLVFILISCGQHVRLCFQEPLLHLVWPKW